MDIFKTFATNETLEQEGTWVQLAKGVRLLIARAGNKKYGRLISTLVEKNQATLDTKTDEADQISDDILIEVAAATILLGWEGLQFKGKDIPYSIENALTLLAVKDFRALVTNHSKNIENFRLAAEDLTEKK